MRSIHEREPEWLPEEAELMLAFLEYRSGLDSNGMPLSEAMSELADPNNYSPDGWRYVPRGPHINWAEKARLDAIDAYRKASGEDANLNGMAWMVERIDNKPAG